MAIDQAQMLELQRVSQQQGRRITPEEYAAIGGNPAEYYKLYNDPAPTLDDSTTLGQAQQIAELERYYNRIDEENPYGSSRYVRNPDGSYKRVTELSPYEQSKLEQEYQREWGTNQLAKQMQDQLFKTHLKPIDESGLPGRPDLETFQQQRQDATDSYYNLATQDFEENFDRDRRGMEQNLANRGIPVGSERWTNELDDFERRRQNAYGDARDRSILGGRGEFESLFDRAQSNRGQAFNEALTLRQQPLQELAGVLSLNKGVNNPAFSPTYNVDIGGLAQGFGGQGLQSEQLAQQMQIAQMQDETQRYLAQLAMKNSGGGGAVGDDGSAFEQDLIKMIFASQLDQQNQAPRPSVGDGLLGIAGTAAGGIAAGLGQGFFGRSFGDMASIRNRGGGGAFSF